MELSETTARGLVLLGCGKMGSALLKGWLARGVQPDVVHVVEPHPSDWLQSAGVALNGPLPQAPAVVVLAVKPQMMAEALPQVASLAGSQTLFISIAAGTSLARLRALLGDAAIVRAMPNTPAAIGRGITALIGNARVSAAQMALAEALMRAAGQAVRLDDEAQMDAVTAVSGSGPAYVFHLIETMAAAGTKAGLPAEMALHLARATVAGAGALAEAAEETPGQLRDNVTSPGGTTAAALKVLMDERAGFPALLDRAVAAAAARARELDQ
jgi:pyrroline-5-carboxylate reductase